MRIDDESLSDDVTVALRDLNRLAKILRARRKLNGYVRVRSDLSHAGLVL